MNKKYYTFHNDEDYSFLVEFITDSICHIRIEKYLGKSKHSNDKTEEHETALNRYGFIHPEDVEVDVGIEEKEAMTIFSSNNVMVKLYKCGDLEISGHQSGKNLKQSFANKGYKLNDKAATLNMSLDQDEEIFGFGDLNREYIPRRGTIQDCQVTNVSGYIPVPFFISDKGYSVLFNTTYRIMFDIGKSNSDILKVVDRQGVIDFYFMDGADLKDAIKNYTFLTGKPEMPPLWSFGLWYLCRTQADDFQVMSEALNFRREGIPCDVMGLEPGWMEKNYDYSVDKDWNSKSMSAPSWAKYGSHSMTAAIKRMGYHLELWLCNDYDLSYEEERKLKKDAKETETSVKNDHALDDDAFEMDKHFSSAQRLDTITKIEEPWFDHLKDFVDQGVDFFKQDGANQVLDHPDRLYGNGMTDAEMHNLYPLLYNKQMYNGFKEHTNRRPLVFTVSGWTGFQRNCLTWTGDTGGKIKTLGAILNLSLCGHSFGTNDMEVTEKEGIHLGFMLPLAQLNNWTYWRQPWYLGDKLFPVFKYYANLRARLIPYYYTMAFESHKTGIPLIRPVFLEFTNVKEFYHILNQYLIGKSFMVSAFTDQVTFPEGKWCDYWTGDIIHGNNATISYQYPDDRGGGIFLREGAIIPTCKEMDYRGQKNMDEITFEIFPCENESEFTLYEDDGVSMEYQNSHCALTKIKCIRQDASISVTIDKRSGDYSGMQRERFYNLKVFGVGEQKIKDVMIDEIRCENWEIQNNILIINKFGDANQISNVLITF